MPWRIVKLFRERLKISLRLRLTLWIVAFFTTIHWVVCGVFWLYQSSSINQIFNRMLAERSMAVAADVAGVLPNPTKALLEERADEAVRSIEYESFLIDVFGASGEHKVLDSAPLVDPESLPIDRAFESALPVPVPAPAWGTGLKPWKGGTRAVVVGMAGSDGLPYVLFVATSDRYAREQLALVGRVLLASALIVPLATLLSGWFIAGVAAAPFHRAQQLVRQLGPKSLNTSILSDSSSSEVTSLAEELERARVRIQEAFAARERFLSNVSHEIKTPIAVMLLEAETINVEGQSEDVVYFVGSVHDEMTRLGKLVESFLTLTRIEDGHERIRGKPIAANDLAMDSVEHCAVMANQSRVWLRPSLFADDDSIDTLVAGDPDLLTTMLDNLIRNAIRFSPPGAGVRVDLLRDESRVEIAVRDAGPGIPESRLATVFDRFSQAGTAERRGRGHGLGLAIARGIAELHGGTISVSNLPQGGCEFRVVLPRVEEVPRPRGTNGRSRTRGETRP